MNDMDADEIVRQRKQSDRMPIFDKALVGTGIALAGLAMFFPWYAFLNQEKFALPALWNGATQDLPEKIGTPGMASAPEASPSEPAQTLAAETQAAVDRLVTATVPAPAATAGEPAEPMLDQPLPGSITFKLVHVAGGRALIEDVSGMYIVRVGSPLPDNSRLATLEERDGNWVMITSRGDVFKAE
ncbi:flagellar protein [Rhizobium sp. DKSPLA3]|uniref:Flagellar protein n=1 Tax=Rhizobium quercicola TaxID=2901226 RepID=A0A9X1NSA8_9HYPH|nr:flagellar protein [Rhizobium quercicola]MCD7108471.1 flagellar protein [Rhizobium quercicola]